MSGEFGMRDVLEQVGARLGNVEVELRQLRTEMGGRFGQVDSRFAQVDSRFAQVDNRFAQVDAKIDRTTRWLVGLMLLSWLSLMVSIWLKP
ncbi:MAG: hypothetical protein AB1505_11150 [Candidatus Latescibacterota bacterium]